MNGPGILQLLLEALGSGDGRIGGARRKNIASADVVVYAQRVRGIYGRFFGPSPQFPPLAIFPLLLLSERLGACVLGGGGGGRVGDSQ